MLDNILFSSSMQCVEKMVYLDTSRYNDVPTYASMRAYLKDISDVLVAKTLRIEGVAPETVGLHLLILKLFVAFHTNYTIFSQVALKLKKYFLGEKMNKHFNTLPEVELDRMADLLDYALVCKKLNKFVSVNGLCKEIEKNKNIHSNNKDYYYALLSYLNGVSSGIKLAYDPLKWLENRFRFIADNLNSIFSRWHLLPRLEQVHLLYSAFTTLSNVFAILIERTENSEVTESNTETYGRVWNLNEKAQFLYFHLQTLLGISDFREVDGEENKKLTEYVYRQKFQLQTALLNYYEPKLHYQSESREQEHESSNYTFN